MTKEALFERLLAACRKASDQGNPITRATWGLAVLHERGSMPKHAGRPNHPVCPFGAVLIGEPVGEQHGWGKVGLAADVLGITAPQAAQFQRGYDAGCAASDPEKHPWWQMGFEFGQELRKHPEIRKSNQ